MNVMRIGVFVIVVGLMFPVFGFALTNFTGSPTQYDITIDPDSLLHAGISVGYGESYNVTFNGAYQYYSFNQTNLRCKWDSSIAVGNGYIWFEKRSIVGNILDSWLFVHLVEYIQGANVGGFQRYIYNATIVNNYDAEYNWSRFKLLDDGIIVLITPYKPTVNITTSVYTDGIVTVTCLETLRLDESLNFRSFISWYFGLLLRGETYGLPSFISWIARILTAIQVFGIIVVAKELTRV